MDSQVAVLGNQAMNYLVSGKAPGRLGNGHPNIVPYEVFPVADGHVIIAVGNDGQFAKLCACLNAPDLAAHDSYATNKGRVTHRAALVPLIAELTRGWARSDLLAALEKLAVPAGPINTIADVFADRQVIARGLRRELDGVPTVASPIVMDGERMVADRASPALGGDAEAIRRDWGV
jgi:crotonobetainyl-CoA:carnitine CoA-transferase CaiB-like acyl-CoA transferase